MKRELKYTINERQSDGISVQELREIISDLDALHINSYRAQPEVTLTKVGGIKTLRVQDTR